MGRIVALLFIAVILLQGAVLAAPFTYCLVGGELCCEGCSGEVSCPTPNASGLNSCCNGNGLLLSSKAPSRFEVQPVTDQPQVSGFAHTAPRVLTALQPFAAPTPFVSPPHLSSVVLRI